jgi:hypothetical protein
LFSYGADLFVSLGDIVAVWETLRWPGPMPPENCVPATKQRNLRSDAPTIDATPAYGPLAQLISMTEWTLPPVAVDRGDTAAAPPSPDQPRSALHT